ncbi:MAG: hypothetical protein AAGG07_05990 [Planctomycetota bacterium]
MIAALEMVADADVATARSTWESARAAWRNHPVSLDHRSRSLIGETVNALSYSRPMLADEILEDLSEAVHRESDRRFLRFLQLMRDPARLGSSRDGPEFWSAIEQARARDITSADPLFGPLETPRLGSSSLNGMSPRFRSIWKREQVRQGTVSPSGAILEFADQGVLALIPADDVAWLLGAAVSAGEIMSEQDLRRLDPGFDRLRGEALRSETVVWIANAAAQHGRNDPEGAARSLARFMSTGPDRASLLTFNRARASLILEGRDDDVAAAAAWLQAVLACSMPGSEAPDAWRSAVRFAESNNAAWGDEPGVPPDPHLAEEAQREIERDRTPDPERLALLLLFSGRSSDGLNLLENASLLRSPIARSLQTSAAGSILANLRTPYGGPYAGIDGLRDVEHAFEILSSWGRVEAEAGDLGAAAELWTRAIAVIPSIGPGLTPEARQSWVRQLGEQVRFAAQSIPQSDVPTLIEMIRAEGDAAHELAYWVALYRIELGEYQAGIDGIRRSLDELRPVWTDDQIASAQLIESLSLIRLRRFDDAALSIKAAMSLSVGAEQQRQALFLNGWLELIRNDTVAARLRFAEAIDRFGVAPDLRVLELIARLERAAFGV